MASHSCTGESVTHPIFRPVKITAGQADGIQPRTIEVLQVWKNQDFSRGRSLVIFVARAMASRNLFSEKEHDYTWQWVPFESTNGPYIADTMARHSTIPVPMGALRWVDQKVDSQNLIWPTSLQSGFRMQRFQPHVTHLRLMSTSSYCVQRHY